MIPASFCAQANDSTYGSDNGGIQLTVQTDVTMQKEVLTISEEQIEVDYVLFNGGDQDVVAKVDG